ncbi:MAG: acetylornithine deacetylase [Rhodobacterales bacterium CG15_BIG_FIL_POST_REV_8_21_14_020_59_13]|nr:MAG: acetylornithine deacetylase [Rhodobacterales bacterium CG15_BIG_FIL_POST_REV_8_21_14_020_59_13]
MTAKVELNADERAALDWIDTCQDQMVTTLCDWVNINSGSRNAEGLEAMRGRLNTAFSALGGEVRAEALKPTIVVEKNGEVHEHAVTPSFHLIQRPDAPVKIVLTGHHDTVFPADDSFQSWVMRDDNIMNGPGAADMKGGLLVMLHALLALERSPLKDQIGYDILISPDEEIGSQGSGPILHELGLKADIGMTYEPALADGSLAGARKGSGNWSLKVSGKAAHAGREHHLGRNAIVAASAFAHALDDLNGQREGVTFNVARIDGGGPPNVVPANAVVRFNIRVKDADDQAWVLSNLERLTADTAKRDGISAEMFGGFTRPAKPMTPANAKMFEWTKAAGSALGLDIQWNATGGVCEGNNLWAAGCPNVDTLGVCGADIHSHEEIVLLDSLTERAKLSAIMLMKFAAGEFDAKTARKLARRET